MIRLIAILGGSGSGKSRLGLELAQKLDCEIFSLDSLSIYQEINISSAKPTKKELMSVHHYGINILSPLEHNNASLFCSLLQEAICQTQEKRKKALLIIGGSSFYLKSIIDGLSPLPAIQKNTLEEIKEKIANLTSPLEFLQSIESKLPFSHQDTYRVHKYLEIYFSTGVAPSVYFQQNPKIPFPYKIEKYALSLPREILRERITLRSEKMLEMGILDEAKTLLEKYGGQIQPFGSIGLKECKEYFEGKIKNTDELLSLISTHTIQLAKRQNTFNRTQFGTPLALNEVSNFKDYALEHIVQGGYHELLRSI